MNIENIKVGDIVVYIARKDMYFSKDSDFITYDIGLVTQIRGKNQVWAIWYKEPKYKEYWCDANEISRFANESEKRKLINRIMLEEL